MESKINQEVIDLIIKDVNEKLESKEVKLQYFMYELARFFNARKATEIYKNKNNQIV